MEAWDAIRARLEELSTVWRGAGYIAATDRRPFPEVVHRGRW